MTKVIKKLNLAKLTFNDMSIEVLKAANQINDSGLAKVNCYFNRKEISIYVHQNGTQKCIHYLNGKHPAIVSDDLPAIEDMLNPLLEETEVMYA